MIESVINEAAELIIEDREIKLKKKNQGFSLCLNHSFLNILGKVVGTLFAKKKKKKINIV